MINIGESYFSISFGNNDGKEEDPNNMNINIKVVSGTTKYVPLNFQPSKTSIRIGRHPECEVAIDDNMLSRYHCFIEYNSVVGWIIQDGYIAKKNDIYEKLNSTNGTWMYLNDDFPVFEGMQFKAFQTLFQVKIHILNM
jgi:hypothetical protein